MEDVQDSAPMIAENPLNLPAPSPSLQSPSPSPGEEDSGPAISSYEGGSDSSTDLSLPASSTEPTCPICGRGVPANVIEGHVERCLRRSSASAQQRLRVSYSYSDDDDLSEYSDGGVDGSQKKKTSRKRPRKQSSPNSDMEESKHGITLDDWEERNFQHRTQQLDMNRYFTTTAPGAKVYQASWERLFDYQREGVSWLHKLFLDKAGGILGDEMGLGKTAQVCCHLNSIAAELSHASFLIVCPATLMRHWLEQLHTWAPSLRVVIMHSVSATFEELRLLGDEMRHRAMKKLIQSSEHGLVVIMSYEGLRANISGISAIRWSAVCLDEGQKIRNPDAEVTLACKRLQALHRIILSGTPIQNRLQELWSLMDFVCPGKLGTREVFDVEIATPIREGNYRNASKFRYELGVRTAMALQELIRPYFLRFSTSFECKLLTLVGVKRAISRRLRSLLRSMKKCFFANYHLSKDRLT